MPKKHSPAALDRALATQISHTIRTWRVANAGWMGAGMIWIYYASPDGDVLYDRTMPLTCGRQASDRVSELRARGRDAWSTRTRLRGAFV